MGCSDGFAVLEHLQCLCVPQDSDAMQAELAHFHSFRLKDNESIQRYYVPFNRTC